MSSLNPFMSGFTGGAQMGMAMRGAKQRKEIGGLAALGQYSQAAQKADEYGMSDLAAGLREEVRAMDKATQERELQTSKLMSQEALGILSMTDPRSQQMGIAEFGQKYGYPPDKIVQAQQNPQLMMQVAAGFEQYANILSENMANVKLSDGEQLVTGRGDMLAENVKDFAPPEPIAAILTDQYYAQNPDALKRAMDLKAAGKSTTTVSVDAGHGGQARVLTNEEKRQMGLPEDAVMQYDHNGNIKTVADSRQSNFYKAQATMKSLDSTSNVVLRELDRAIEKVGPLTAGPLSPSAAIPGTAARDLKALIDTIVSNIGFDKLQDMRNNSPTGGALGQVSNLEITLLQSVQGSLDLGQSPSQLIENMNNLRIQLIELQQARREAYQSEYAEFLGGQHGQSGGGSQAMDNDPHGLRR